MAADMNVSDGVADQMGYFEEPERNIYGTMPTTEGAAEMGASPYFDTGIGSEMAQGQFDPSGVDFNAGAKLTQQQGSQSLLNQFNTSQAASDFGLSATFDPATGQYVTDLGGFGFTGDQRYKRQSPEEFAAQFAGGVKPAQETKIAAPPAITGGIATINPGATQAAQAAAVAANRMPPAVRQPPTQVSPQFGMNQYGMRTM